MGEWLAIGSVSGKKTIAGTFKDEESPVYRPSLDRWESILVDDVSHVLRKLAKALSRLWCWEFAIIEGRTNPHVVHERWKSYHHACNTKGTTEVHVARIVNLRI